MECSDDKEVPAENSSLLLSKTSSGNEVKWTRPCKMCEGAQLRKPNEISLPVQGLLGDCWLMCAFYTLAHNQKAWQLVFKCENQNLFGFDYSGRITVQLWMNGCWGDVTIDDCLPVTPEEGKVKLIYSKCADGTQFWVPLLEKAFAKVYGSYKSLNSGQISEGYMMLHGGYTWKEAIPESAKDNNDRIGSLIQKISLLLENGNSGMTTDSFVFLSKCSEIITQDSRSLDRNYGSLHCYCIKSLDKIGKPKITLWNPWRKANHTPDEELRVCDLVKYRMTITYTTLNLNKIFSCNHETNTLIHEKVLYGEWVACLNSGGNKNTRTFHRNPQFILTLETNKSSDSGFAHLTLLQASKRQWGSRKELLQAIAIHVWKLPGNTSTALTHEQVKRLNEETIKSTQYVYDQITALTFPTLRNQDSSFPLQYYLVIPSTYAPDVNGTFFLRASTSFPMKCFCKLPLKVS